MPSAPAGLGSVITRQGFLAQWRLRFCYSLISPVYWYYPGRAHMAPKLRVFIDYFCHKAILPSQQSHHR
ncbi:hypothetical protein DUP93_07060 [Salmonella enterica subsp. enterica serovar Toulon]|nr:hypothetical protein [Salmonella enterica subsp. enterica serovar Toulon]